jgi:hypothetical protein
MSTYSIRDLERITSNQYWLLFLHEREEHKFGLVFRSLLRHQFDLL